MAEERLQNILARAGVASRRGAAAIIEAGRVTVDGIVVREAGARFDPEAAAVAVDGDGISAAETRRTIMLYKPVGVLSSMSDPFGGTTVADLIRGGGRRKARSGRQARQGFRRAPSDVQRR